MKGWLIISILILLCACSHTWERSGRRLKTIEVGDYLFDFPADFELAADQGIDSYVGRIEGDSLSFGFDFGYYSDDFGETCETYLAKGSWRSELSYRFMKEGMTYDHEHMPEVNILSIRPATAKDSSIGGGCDYVATCKYEDTVFNAAIYIPTHIRQLNYEIDTIGNMFRKIVYAKDPEKGITGIYLRQLNGFNSSINSYLALSMATRTHSRLQQEIALGIFKTGRSKKQAMRAEQPFTIE